MTVSPTNQALFEAKLLFVRVVEVGSFKRAAEQLAIEPSSISRKIAMLEQQLNVKLLRRSTHKTMPTQLGQIYYEQLCVLLSGQAALDEQISQNFEQIAGLLRLSAPVDFGTQFVVPVCQQLQQRYPQLQIEMQLGSQFEDLLQHQIDVAIRIGQLQNSSLIAKPLGDVQRVMVASLEYLQKYGEPTTLIDLIQNIDQHNFIFYSYNQKNSPINFADGTQIAHKLLRSNFMVNSVTAIRQLVIAGVGIHIGPKWFFQQEIAQGRVRPILSDYPLTSFPVYAVYPYRQFVSKKVQAFITAMMGSLSEI